MDGSNTNGSSFFREYHFKLKNIYNKSFTKQGQEIALSRQKSVEDFYNALLSEVKESEERGRKLLRYL